MQMSFCDREFEMPTVIIAFLTFASFLLPHQDDRPQYLPAFPWSYPARYTQQMELTHEWKIEAVEGLPKDYIRSFRVEEDRVFLQIDSGPYLYQVGLDGKECRQVSAPEHFEHIRKSDLLMDGGKYCTLADRPPGHEGITVAVRDFNGNHYGYYPGSPYDGGLPDRAARSFAMLRTDGQAIYFAAVLRAACVKWDIETGDKRLIVVDDEILYSDWQVKKRNADRYLAEEVVFSPVLEGFDLLGGKPCFFVSNFYVNKMFAIRVDDSGDIEDVYFAMMPDREPGDARYHPSISPLFTTVNGTTYLVALHGTSDGQVMRVYRMPD
jgi:hypothetical protein